MDYTPRRRSERYIFERLDVNLNRVGVLEGVRSCGLDWSIYTTYAGSGDLSVRTSRDIVWPQTLVRPWIVVENRTGRQATPLMTCVCRVPEQDYAPKGVEAEVQLYDRTLILDEWLLTDRHVVTAGTKYTDAMQAIFVALGITTYSITVSTLTTTKDLIWLPSESESVSWLRVLNDLADAAGYFAVRTDARGWFQCQPYVAPGDRSPAWRFADDGVSQRYLPRVRVAHAGFMTYNAWSYWSRADGDTAPVGYYAANDDPTHPYSTVNLGRAITRRRTDVEGDVQAALDRDRAEDLADQRTFEIEARYVPVLEHDAVELASVDASLSTVATVAKRSLTCAPGSKLRLTLREVLS